jgi:hypothetical protein
MLLRSDDAAPEILLEEPLELSASDLIKRGDQEVPTAQELEEVRHALPVVSVGSPLVWPLPDILGTETSDLLRVLLHKEDLYLVRLYCSFRPRQDDLVITSAEFRATFRSGSPSATPVVYDLDPRDVSTELKRTRQVTLSPNAKFSEVEAGLGSASFGLEYSQLMPMITAGGDGESTAYWEYSATKASAITGGKWMHAVIRAPKTATCGFARIDLVAEVKQRGRLLSTLLRRTRATGTDPLDVALW